MSLSVHFVVDPRPNIFRGVTQGIGSVSFYLVKAKLSLIKCSCCVFQFAVSVLEALVVVTLVPVTIWPFSSTMSLLHIISPLPFVFHFVGVLIHSISVFVVAIPLSNVLCAI